MTHAIDVVVATILFLALLVMEFIATVDTFLTSMMGYAGLPPIVQSFILVFVAIFLIVLVIRLFGRVFAALIIILLVLLVVHRLDPAFNVPLMHVPYQPQPSTQT
jgi:hypothetical protein